MNMRKYLVAEFHEGMARAIGDNKECGYVNFNKEVAIKLTDEAGKIVFAEEKDINWEDSTIKTYENSVRGLWSSYYLGGSDFKNGVALVSWTILPDGGYFADENGFGAEDNEEVNIHCYIDKKGKVIIPFQAMTENQIEEFRKIAENMVSRKGT